MDPTFFSTNQSESNGHLTNKAPAYINPFGIAGRESYLTFYEKVDSHHSNLCLSAAANSLSSIQGATIYATHVKQLSKLRPMELSSWSPNGILTHEMIKHLYKIA